MLGAMELIIIGLAFLLLFGPDKIPKIAKDFGRAWGELRKFQDELAIEVNAGTEGMNLGLGGTQRATPTREPISGTSSFKLKQMARKLGLDVTDKKDSQIIDAINLQMAKISLREDGRAIFKELQDETREQRQQSIEKKRAEMKQKVKDREAAKKDGAVKKDGEMKTTTPVDARKKKPDAIKNKTEKTPLKTTKKPGTKKPTATKNNTEKTPPKTAVKPATKKPAKIKKDTSSGGN